MDKARTADTDAITEIEMLRYELASLTSRLLSLYHENMKLRQILDNKKQPASSGNMRLFTRRTADSSVR